MLNYSENYICYSDLESKRYGYNMYRSYYHEILVNEIMENIIRNNIDILILRIPSEEQVNLYKLDRMGFPYIVGDTLLYYSLDLDKTLNTLRNNINFVQCKVNDVCILDRLVRSIFNGYTNHYKSNPYLDERKTMDGFCEWACSYANGEIGKVVWLAFKNEKPIGFASCKYSELSGESEGVLYGVLPDESGQGIYGDIIRFTQGYFKKLGYKTMYVSTQSNNYAVQKVWNREGFSISNSYITIHINSFLNINKSSIKKTFKFSLKNKGKGRNIIIDDKNEVQIFNDFRKADLENEIDYKTQVVLILSRYLDTALPESVTITLIRKMKYVFIEPLYIDQTYFAEINFIHSEDAKYIDNVILKIFCGMSKIKCIAYFSFLNNVKNENNQPLVDGN